MSKSDQIALGRNQGLAFALKITAEAQRAGKDPVEELKLMQGFPKDYIIAYDYHWNPYPKTQQVARIGNSVVPIMARAIIEANCSEIKVGERKPRLYVVPGEDGQMAFA